jgi:hypothetical protein
MRQAKRFQVCGSIHNGAFNWLLLGHSPCSDGVSALGSPFPHDVMVGALLCFKFTARLVPFITYLCTRLAFVSPYKGGKTFKVSWFYEANLKSIVVRPSPPRQLDDVFFHFSSLHVPSLKINRVNSRFHALS